jgi:hypothetical protein
LDTDFDINGKGKYFGFGVGEETGGGNSLNNLYKHFYFKKQQHSVYLAQRSLFVVV